MFSSRSSSTSSSSISLNSANEDHAPGLYKPFAELAWDRILERVTDLTSLELPEALSSNQALAAPAAAATVHITLKAAQSSTCYARFALLETVSPKDAISGIQVLNMIIIPHAAKGMPVWGADLVALPGNKHLLLLDAQPVSDQDNSPHWKDWYDRHNENFPWGGDLPEAVQPYVSQCALWSRLTEDDSIPLIQGPFMNAFQEHLEIYLEFLTDADSNHNSKATVESRLQDYLQYRVDNDPARPMLKRLYGEEWTERVLHEVLFPDLSQ